jgi:hypothetical protein
MTRSLGRSNGIEKEVKAAEKGWEVRDERKQLIKFDFLNIYVLIGTYPSGNHIETRFSGHQ